MNGCYSPLVFESKNVRLRLVKEKADPKFINYQLLLNGWRHFAANAQQVVGMASVNQKQLGEFSVVLPPLDIQQASSRRSKGNSPASTKPSPCSIALRPTSNVTKPPSSKPPSKGNLCQPSNHGKRLNLVRLRLQSETVIQKNLTQKGGHAFSELVPSAQWTWTQTMFVTCLMPYQIMRPFLLATVTCCSHDITEVETMSEFVRGCQQICLPRFTRTSSYECVCEIDASSRVSYDPCLHWQSAPIH